MAWRFTKSQTGYLDEYWRFDSSGNCCSADVVQYGKQANGTQRYRCNNRDCPRTIFLLQYQDKGRLPAVKQQIIDMTLNGSDVRDIVRVLRVSSATVIDVLKKN